MPTTLRKQLHRAAMNALMERDRIEIQAIDALLSTIRPHRCRRTRAPRTPTAKLRVGRRAGGAKVAVKG